MQPIPFRSVIRALHGALEAAGVAYSIIGGVAVVRAGSVRTTGDIDILVRRDEWHAILARDVDESEVIEFGQDWADHRVSGVPIDVLFAGDDWELPFLMPNPEGVREWDDSAGAWFMKPAALLELKAAIYQSKLREYGASVAAKDLSDVSSLLASRPELRRPDRLERLHPSVRETVRQAVTELEQQERRGPKRPK